MMSDCKFHNDNKFEKELENDVIKLDDFVESDVKTEVLNNELAKLKSEGVLRSKVTAEKMENEEASCVEEKIMLDVMTKISTETLNDENPDERSAKRFITEEKNLEKNNDQWMQSSTAKLKPKAVLMPKITAEKVENEEASCVEEKIMLDVKTKRNGETLNDENPDESSATSFITEEKNLEKNNGQLMQMSTAKLKSKGVLTSKITAVKVENEETSCVEEKIMLDVKMKRSRETLNDVNPDERSAKSFVTEEKNLEKNNGQLMQRSTAKLKSKGVLTSKITAVKVENEEASCVEERIMLDVKTKRSRETLNDVNPDERSAKSFVTEEKNLEKNNGQLMQRSTAKLKSKGVLTSKMIAEKVENEEASCVEEKIMSDVKTKRSRKALNDENADQRSAKSFIAEEKNLEKINDQLMQRSTAKLKSKGVLRSKITAEKMENEEASCVEEKIMLDVKTKGSRETLTDENPDEKSVKRFITKEKNLEKNNDQWMQTTTAKLKSKGAWRSKITAEKMENEEAPCVEDKIMVDVKTKRSIETLNDENPDAKSVKRVLTKEKNLEKNNDQWMQRSTARTLRKLKYVNTASDDLTASMVEDKVVGRTKRAYNRKAKEDGSKSKEMKIEKPNKEISRPASTETTSRIKSGESKSTAKQKIREQIKSILLNAGWKIDLRPRNGRDYFDSVYIPPTGGGGFWSITKAYNIYLKHNKTEETMCASAVVPQDQVNMLTRVVVNKRGSGKNKISEKNKQGLKIRKGTNDVVKARKKRGMGMSVHDAKQDDDDAYEPYVWKRSILSWMIDMGVINVDGKVKYMDQGKSQALLEGSITRDGILCGCCDKTICVSTFEIHAGSKINQPYQNTVLENKGVSLLDCQINAWEKQKESEKQDFYEVDIGGDDDSDDTCGICGDGGDLLCCDGCPSTFHLNCLDMEMLPPDDWRCTNCSCRYCNLVSTVDLEGDDSVISMLLTCLQCEKKYHCKCVPCEDSIAISSSDSDASFCGKSCKKVFEQLQKFIGIKNELESGLSWSIYHRFRDYSSEHHLSIPKKVESNSKIAVAFTVMDECFCPFIDPRTGINLIHNVVYNCGSNINRVSYSGFYTFVLERGDEIIAVASVRIHGTRLAEMPFIGTRYRYRRQGMCRQLLSGIESALYSLNVENLIIPAISELKETWTGSFGFNHLSYSERQEVKSTSIIVFNGTGLLHKPVMSKSLSNGNSSPIGDISVLPKVDDQNEHGEKTHIVSTCNEPETNSEHEADFHKESVVEMSATNLSEAVTKVIPDLNVPIDSDDMVKNSNDKVLQAATGGEFH